MPERVLSDEEVSKLGLDKPKAERVLSDDEVKQLGLDAPPAKKGPDYLDRTVALQEKMMPELWGALAAGAHGAAAGMEGPINGVLAGAKEDLKNLFTTGSTDPTKAKAAYDAEKHRIEGAQAENLKAHPVAPVVGALMSAGAGTAPTAAGRIGMSALQGTAYGIGGSKNDLDKNPAGLGLDAAKGLAIGTAGGLLGEAAQLPGRYLAGKAQALSDATHAAELASEAEKRAAAVASTRGAYGGEVSSGQRILEMVERASSDPKADPALQQAAKAFLDSPEGEALLNHVLKSNLGRSGDAISRIQNARDAMTNAIMANDPALTQQAAAAAANAKLMSLSGVTNRVAELARRNIPPAVGAAVGGAPGAAAGALVAGSMGKPGTILSNMLKSPSMYRPLTAAASTGIGAGEAMSRATPPALESWSRFLKPDEEQ